MEETQTYVPIQIVYLHYVYSQSFHQNTLIDLYGNFGKKNIPNMQFPVLIWLFWHISIFFYRKNVIFSTNNGLLNLTRMYHPLIAKYKLQSFSRISKIVSKSYSVIVDGRPRLSPNISLCDKTW
eukprot:78581_1